MLKLQFYILSREIIVKLRVDPGIIVTPPGEPVVAPDGQNLM